MKSLLVFIMFLVTSGATAMPTLNEAPANIILEDKMGGRVDGQAWSSESIREKVHVLFYVDPDEKDANLDFEELLNKKDYDREKFTTVAVINMAATWKPNWIISSILKSKQKKYPKTTYVKDLKRVLVEKWQLSDDAYNIVIFDKTGKVLFSKAGKLSKDETTAAIAAIESHL